MTFSPIGTQESIERPLPQGIGLRRGTLGFHSEDEQGTFEVMHRAMGYASNWAHHAPTRRHLRSAPHSSYWLAEERPWFGRPRIVGYAHSIVRDRVWSLTEFFVLPSHHRQGIGRALLNACLRDGEMAGADTRLVLASHHTSADALYMRRAGCFPRIPMCLLSGPAAHLQFLPPGCAIDIHDDQSLPPVPRLARPLSGVTRVSNGASPFRTGSFSLNSAVKFSLDGALAALLRRKPTPVRPSEPVAIPPAPRPLFPVLPLPEITVSSPLIASPVVLTPEVQAEVDALDREIVGFARPPEHRFWTQEMEVGRLFREKETGRLVGYAYFGSHASGPALAVDPQLLPSMLAHITRFLPRQTPDFDSGFRISTDTDSPDTVGSAEASGFVGKDGLADPPAVVEPNAYCAVAGTNEVMLQWLLGCGWQIAFQYLFMSSRPIGHMDRYVCHNPLYLL